MPNPKQVVAQLLDKKPMLLFIDDAYPDDEPNKIPRSTRLSRSFCANDVEGTLWTNFELSDGLAAAIVSAYGNHELDGARLLTLTKDDLKAFVTDRL